MKSQANAAVNSCNCKVVSSPNAILAANLAFEYKAPEAPTSEAQQLMIDRSKHLSGNSGTYIKNGSWGRPLTNALAKQENVINSSNSVGVNNVRLAKANAAIEAVTGLAKALGYFVKEDQIAYYNSQIANTASVVSFMQEAINGKVQGVTIPGTYLNAKDLSSVANYLLKGEIAYNYSTTHSGEEVKTENTGLMNVAKQLLNVINQRNEEKKNNTQTKMREGLQRASVDNTRNGGN